jgi:hypothetical protein
MTGVENVNLRHIPMRGVRSLGHRRRTPEQDGASPLARAWEGVAPECGRAGSTKCVSWRKRWR